MTSINKIAGAHSSCGYFKTKVLLFKIENTTVQDTNGKKTFKLMLGFLFVDKRNSSEFRYEIVFREIQPCFFTTGRLACFKPDQGSDVFEETSRVHSVLCGQEK